LVQAVQAVQVVLVELQEPQALALFLELLLLQVVVLAFRATMEALLAGLVVLAAAALVIAEEPLGQELWAKAIMAALVAVVPQKLQVVVAVQEVLELRVTLLLVMREAVEQGLHQVFLVHKFFMLAAVAGAQKVLLLLVGKVVLEVAVRA
jgi:hypothetical protein